jgi:ubiquinone/menaquinone biosynthesis C-methylase UbiE
LKKKKKKNMAGAPPKQSGETSFVNYMDASKNYDAARDPLGCDIILGSMAMAKTGVPLHEQHLLDEGCGTGNYVSVLVDKVGAVTMQDFSEGMLAKAKAKFTGNPKIKSIDQGDVCHMPYPDATFDACINNQVVQHIETDETRPTRANLRACCKDAFRVLKPGGCFIISTRSKEPHYDHLYWYSVLAPKAVAAMSARVPSRDECKSAMEEAGFEITQCVTPKYASIMNKKHYYDPAGVFSEAWRRGESWWSLVSPEELASLQAEMKKKIDNGTADAWIKERDALREAAGQVLFVCGMKPL